MITVPILHTERLILRSFTLEDAADVKRLASDPDVASTTDADRTILMKMVQQKSGFNGVTKNLKKGQ